MTDLVAAVQRKARASAALNDAFFTEQAHAVEACARELAARLAAGGRLYTFGSGGSACDAQRLAIELMHPIVERRCAFPAYALPTDYALDFARQLELLARPGDIALGLSTSGQSANVVRALRAARQAGLLAIGLTGRDGIELVDACDHAFVVPSNSSHRIQEVHALLLHVLWDLVHLARGEEDVP